MLSFIQQQVKLIHFAWVLHTAYYHQAFVQVEVPNKGHQSLVKVT